MQTGVHWFTYDKMIRQDHRRPLHNGHVDGDNLRTPPVITSSNYHRLSLDYRVHPNSDCSGYAVQLDDPYSYDEAISAENAPTIKTSPPIDDSSPPSYDECVSFIHTKPQTRDISTNEMTTYWYTSV